MVAKGAGILKTITVNLASWRTRCRHFLLPSVIMTKKIDSFSGNKYLYSPFFEHVINNFF